ncbi:MAG: GntR family transcriptional regulator [Pseudomonadota bacterium]
MLGFDQLHYAVEYLVLVQASRGRGRPRYDQEDEGAAEAFAAVGRRIRLRRQDQIPLWVQLKNQIGQAVATGQLAANSRIPSEQALCDLFGVSRPVVRSAISALAAEGQVIKMPRKGMFVASKREAVDFMTANLSVFGDLVPKGHEVTADTLEFVRADPDDEERRVFGFPEDTGSVVRIRRVYYSDGNPLTFTLISLPGHRLPGMENLDIENRSIFETIKQNYGLTVLRAERWLTAEMPTPEVVRLMGVPADRPLVAIESVAYSHDGDVLEFYRAFFNSDAARIHVKIGPDS